MTSAAQQTLTRDRQMIDLRSDTVTLPSAEMREAIATAEVGDDQFGEDPSVNALQDLVADVLGKPAALWCPSGTMSNQVALLTLTSPGDEVIVGTETHAVWHETGASAANAGVQFREVGRDGVFTAADVRAATKPRGHLIFPPTTLVEVENTQNRAGGVVWERSELAAITQTAHELNLATFLDGARLWNAAAADGVSEAELCAGFDLVTVALSKGLGAPAGSALAGEADVIKAAVRARRRLGGAMRQAGILAAAGTYAIVHNRERLVDDHANARLIAEAMDSTAGVRIDLASARTNIVVFHLDDIDGVPDAATVVARAKAEGVAVMAFAPRTVRAVTHLNVTTDQCRTAAEVLKSAVLAGA